MFESYVQYGMFPLFVVVLFCVLACVKAPHPYFAPAPLAPAADGDLETGQNDEDEAWPDDEEPAVKKRRFEKMGGEHIDSKLFGKGVDFTPREKRFILQIFEKCKRVLEARQV